MNYRPYGYYSAEGTHIPKMRPSDFNCLNYEGISCGTDADEKMPVVIMKDTREDSPLRWRVCYGFSQVYFGTFKDAMAFCNGRGMKLIREAEESRYE